MAGGIQDGEVPHKEAPVAFELRENERRESDRYLLTSGKTNDVTIHYENVVPICIHINKKIKQSNAAMERVRRFSTLDKER